MWKWWSTHFTVIGFPSCVFLIGTQRKWWSTHFTVIGFPSCVFLIGTHRKWWSIHINIVFIQYRFSFAFPFLTRLKLTIQIIQQNIPFQSFLACIIRICHLVKFLIYKHRKNSLSEKKVNLTIDSVVKSYLHIKIHQKKINHRVLNVLLSEIVNIIKQFIDTHL